MRVIFETAGFDWDEVQEEAESIAVGEQIRYWSVGPGAASTEAYVKATLGAVHAGEKDEEGRIKTFGAGKKYRVKCCGDIIQSMSRHDMVWCKCGKNSIDGGSAYWCITGDIDDFEEVDDALAHPEG